MNILFVCRHNRFRSKVAEAYFKKINTNKNLIAKSAGIFPGRPIDKDQKRIAKKFDIKMTGKPQAISTNLLHWNDVIIAITDDLPKGLFNYSSFKNKIIEWKIKDDIDGNEKEIEKIIKKIMKNIKEFIKNESIPR